MTDHPASCPVEPERVVMRNEWRRLTFLHWAYDPTAIQRLLPPGLEIETWDERAWVGVVPFMMHARLPRGPYIKGLSKFSETNLRTYVRGPNGEVGVHFFSLEASNPGAVVVGRLGYGVRYQWASMRISHNGLQTRYRSHRRFGNAGVGHDITVERGEPISAPDITPFQHYLTARWSLFGRRRGRTTFARMCHEPWPLHDARVRSWDVTLFGAHNIPRPSEDPIVLTSPGVSVRIGARHHLTPPVA